MNWLEFGICLVLYVVIGWKVLRTAARNIINGDVFDENFLMCAASIGSFILGEYVEAVMVMLLYRVGEYLQDRAVDKSRGSISELMNIRPDYANVEKDGELVRLDPDKVEVGTVITVLAGERIPLDGEVVEGSSRIDTAALTGEAIPEDVTEGSSVCSGVINLDGLLKIRVTKPNSESTATRILALVEEAAESKAKAERFITRFARYYTPIVCGLALLIAVVPPLLLSQPFAGWIHRGLVFLVISCPCALVISVPLSFFAGIGGASSKGILIKGGNYLEALSRTDTVVFDKTGTLTKGVFKVIAVHPQLISEERLLELAAHCESFSNHPISRSLADAYGKKIDKSIVRNEHEITGEGISAEVGELHVSCGNSKLMDRLKMPWHECELPGTVVHVAVDGQYVGHIIISDEVKSDAAQALSELRAEGVDRIVMLTGDKEAVAAKVAEALSISDHKSGMLPEDKLRYTEELLKTEPPKKKLAFVGDGINDAPVLAKADVGIAMGAMGSAAAVEAADIVLMNDRPSDVALARRIAKKTMTIIYENIVFSLLVKLVVLVLSALGYDFMWLAVFADVGVCLLAIINAMRALRIK